MSVDPQVLEALLRDACLSADAVAMEPHTTDADKTRAIVRRTVEVLLGNGMIMVTDADTWPDWVVLDPPYNLELHDRMSHGETDDLEDVLADHDELLDVLADVINQACGPVYVDATDSGELDSMALSAYADGMRLLAKHGRFQILHEAGRRVIGQWERGPR